MFKIMIVFLKPIIPALVEKAEQFLVTEPLLGKTFPDLFIKKRSELFSRSLLA